MFFVDEENYPVNNTKDGADSAVRIGVIATGSDKVLQKYKLYPSLTGICDYVSDSGICVRHPKLNPWNFTRDQLDCLIAGLYGLGEHEVIRKIFWAHFRRGFFCQNFERDLPGSKKYMWPHEFFKDSKFESTPISRTWLKKFNLITLKFESTAPDGCSLEEKNFDFADPVFGSIWHMIKAGKMWYFYWFAIIGIPLYILNVFLQADSNLVTDHPREKNQIYSQSFVNGRWALRFFREIDPNWESHNRNYWTLRIEPEYHELMREVVDAA